MYIKKVDSIEEAVECNHLLTKLINDESQYNSNIRKDYVVENWFENLYYQSNNALYIAVEDDKIVGYTYVKLIQVDGRLELYSEATINGLYVLEGYRKRGIATSLIDKAKEWCKDNGVKYVSLKALAENRQAIELYKKQGFDEFLINLRLEL